MSSFLHNDHLCFLQNRRGPALSPEVSTKGISAQGALTWSRAGGINFPRSHCGLATIGCGEPWIYSLAAWRKVCEAAAFQGELVAGFHFHLVVQGLLPCLHW